MSAYEKAVESASWLRARITHTPQVLVILGSGLGGWADGLQDAIPFGYDQIPHFAQSTVAGHAGALVSGRSGAVDVLAIPKLLRELTLAGLAPAMVRALKTENVRRWLTRGRVGEPASE